MTCNEILNKTENNELVRALSNRKLLMDGAMGTMLQAKSLDENDFRGNLFAEHNRALIGNYDLLSLTNPEIVKLIHREYLVAGAEIIKSNSFNANADSQAKYGTEDYVYRINYAAASIAKELCDDFTAKSGKKRFVAGSIGPTWRLASREISNSNSICDENIFKEFVEIYFEQISGLAAGGADCFLIETVVDSVNAKAAISAANLYNDKVESAIPIIVSCSLTQYGKLLSGESQSEFYEAISNTPNLIAFGMNCGFGGKHIAAYIDELLSFNRHYSIIYPNAGIPNQNGIYADNKEESLEIIKYCLESEDIRIIGGCCGTTPEYIRDISGIYFEK